MLQGVLDGECLTAGPPASPPCVQLETTAFFLVELCLVDYACLRFPPSLLAAAAVHTALLTLNRTAWSTTLQRHSGYTETTLRWDALLAREPRPPLSTPCVTEVLAPELLQWRQFQNVAIMYVSRNGLANSQLVVLLSMLWKTNLVTLAVCCSSRSCSFLMSSLHRKSATANLTAVVKKYSSSKLLCVALLPPCPESPIDDTCSSSD